MLAIINCGTTLAQKKMEISSLSCEYKIDPVGISSQSPRLSWKLISGQRNQIQSAYRIIVADDPEILKSGEGNIWDSKKVDSDQSVLVSYSGSPLKSGEKYYWKIKVWNREGAESGWSKTASWQMGLLAVSDWKNAQWIGYDELPDSMKLVPGLHIGTDKNSRKAIKRTVVPLFRNEFNISGKIKSASLYISGLGQYEAYINGTKIGDAFLTPGWTDYNKTVFYNTYDVSAYLKEGKNAVGVIVGNGFYNINRERYYKLTIAYGLPKMIARLQVKYRDGSEENIISDGNWKTSPSPISFTSIYGGEDYDARLEQKGWNSAGFSGKDWRNAVVVKQPVGKLTAEVDYPLSVKEKIGVKTISALKEGSFLYDFGQNASGIVELKIQGKRGQEVRLIPAELINDQKMANQRASGWPYYYSYTLKGDGIETWRPLFTYYGFRYVQVDGAHPAGRVQGSKIAEQKSGTHQVFDSSADLPRIIELKMLHTRNSTPSTGDFECSNDLFNRINTLILWAIRSNLQSVLTDCPHREKLGWLEQTLLMGGGIHYNFDLYHLYSKQVNDMIEAQTEEGLVPDIAPEYVQFQKGFRDSPEWGSASVVLPWMVYKWYGDKSLMEKAWPMMIRYVNYLKSKSKNNILSHGLGDWFDYGPRRPGTAQLTPIALTATAIYYYDLKLLANMAELLDKKEEKQRISVWANEVKESFNKEFFNPQSCVYSTGSQTAMSMPLCFGMVDDSFREKVVTNLTDTIKAHNKALTAGDVGFHYLVQALTEGGASQLLFEMNNRDDVPGYGFQLKKGATALTESWPALEEVSNNHLMLGHIMEWFYTALGGINQEENSTAYKKISIHPELVGDVMHTKTNFQSPYGLISAEWNKRNNNVFLNLSIPVNTIARVHFNNGDLKQINEGKNSIANNKDFSVVDSSEKGTVIEVGSGEYRFWYKARDLDRH